MIYNDLDEILFIINKQSSACALFLNDFISEINEKSAFTLFGDCGHIIADRGIDGVTFNPWLNEEYELPTVNFVTYQTKVVLALNKFINLKNIGTNLYVHYPLEKDSEGNRFVLKSLIDMAFTNKPSTEWLIFNGFNYSDFEILHHINKHLPKCEKVLILMDDECQLDEMNFDTKELIGTYNETKIIKVKHV